MSISMALSRWADLLGSAAVVSGAASQARYGGCTSARPQRVEAGLLVTQAQQLPEVLRIAREESVPVYPISTGKNWGYGTATPVREGCVVIDLSGMRKILEFDPVLGVVRLEPGVTQADLADFLSAGKHPFLVPVSGAGPDCSILGNALERGYGITPSADHFGAVTSIEAVLADGRHYRSALSELGGKRVDALFKWGVGPYLDGIFTQSALGIVTSATIALAPRPDEINAGIFGLHQPSMFSELVTCVQRVISRHPGLIGGVNLMNQHRVLSMSQPYPEDQLDSRGLVSQEWLASAGKKTHVAPWTGFLTLYGTKAVLRAARRDIRKELAATVGFVMFVSPTEAMLLKRIADRCRMFVPAGLRKKVSLLAASLELANGHPNTTAMPLAYWKSGRKMPAVAPDPARDGCGLIWYAPLVPMDAAIVREFVAMVTRITAKHGIEPLITLTSLSSRVFDSTVPILFDADKEDQVSAAHACYDELLAAGRELGFLPYRFGTNHMSWLTQNSPEHFGLIADLKNALDPCGILSPGRYCI